MSFDKYAARFDAAEPGSNGGNEFPVGIYPRLRVEEIKMHQGREGDDFFIAEFTVLESQNPNKPAGSTGSWVLNMKKDMSPGDAKAFLGTLYGLVDKAEIIRQITTPVMNLAIGPTKPLRGRFISLEVTSKKMKKKGQNGEDLYFPKHVWRPCDGQASSMAIPQTGYTTPAAPAAPAPVSYGAPPLPTMQAHAPAPVPQPLPPPPPPVPVAPPAQFPPVGWLAHPSAPGWFYNGATQEQLPEPDLRNRFGIL